MRWRMLGMSAVVLVGMLAFLRIVTNAIGVIDIRNRRIRAAVARKARRAPDGAAEGDPRDGRVVDAVRLAS